MVNQQSVEQTRIGVAEIAEIAVLVDGSRFEVDLLHTTALLLGEALDGGGNESLDVESLSGGDIEGGVEIDGGRMGSTGSINLELHVGEVE